MKRRTATAPAAGLCPTDPAHGPLLDIDGRPYCPHQSHDNDRIRPAAPRSTAVAPIGRPGPSVAPVEEISDDTATIRGELTPADMKPRPVASGDELRDKAGEKVAERLSLWTL